jgi:23S rRNA (uracil-5-)-methyltransferase RumA
MNLVKGDKIKLDIRKQGINGEGIGYHNKTLVFVPGAINKEQVFVEITDISKSFATGQIIEFTRVSKKRVKPECKYYEDCGGCHMQHIEYKEQLKIKQNILKQALRKYTNLDVENMNIYKTKGMDYFFKYRNKSQMPFRNTNFGLALGFYKPESNHFVYIEECINHHEMINKINKQVLTSLRKHGIKAYDSQNKDGILFYLVTRYLESTNSASVTFIVREFDERLKQVAIEITDVYNSIKSVSYSISDPKSNLVMSNKVNMISGKKWIEDSFGDYRIKLSPDAFHQLNSKQMEVLYDSVVRTAELNDNSIVFDLYCGVGITSLLLAKYAKKVIGIDYSHASIKDAIENSKLNKITNTDFIVGHVEREMPDLIKKGVKPHLVLLDPPRKGLAKPVVDALLKSLPKQIIYVSCNPSTLAKNIAEISHKYDVVSIQPVDMFPNTASVESVTLLKLKN